MKNVSSKLTKNTESPKTPGGISKSLLTPCRRVGLSRNWKKSGPSPFISPLSSASNTPEIIKSEQVSRKRKICSPEKELKSQINCENRALSNTPPATTTEINSSNTPRRNASQRKKSKAPLLEDTQSNNTNDLINNKSDSEGCDKLQTVTVKKQKSTSKLSRQSSRLKYENSPKKGEIHDENVPEDIFKNNLNTKSKQVSPNNLTKECIVVIQNKINKHIINKQIKTEDTHPENINAKLSSQAVFDSDSDDVPLCELNKNEVKKDNMEETNKESNQVKKLKLNTPVTNEKQIQISEKKSEEVFVKKLEDKKTSTGDLNTKRSKLSTRKAKNVNLEIPKPITQVADFDDDDDDQFDTKRTIVIRKTYNKVSKPLKSKSTGSITDQDIEQLKARIEEKKKLLLIKALNPETEELRGLIKKWQKGCQSALMELMELMKKRMPEQNVDNSEILQMLKIPPDLVGYDSDNDCFNTPDDETIVLSSLNIL